MRTKGRSNSPTDDLRAVARRLGIPQEVAEAVEKEIDEYVEAYKKAALKFWEENYGKAKKK